MKSIARGKHVPTPCSAQSNIIFRDWTRELELYSCSSPNLEDPRYKGEIGRACKRNVSFAIKHL